MSEDAARPVKAAVIGCGNIAGRYDELGKRPGCYTHAGAYGLAGVDIVAAADPNPDRRSAFARNWQVPHVYADHRDLLARHRVDVVSVCVPDLLHEEIIGEVLAVMRPPVVFAEKPLARDRRGARALLDRAKDVGTRIVVNNQRRWESGHRRAAALIREGGVGDVVTVTALYVRGLYHIGSTAVDTVRFLITEVDAVQALHGKHVASVPDDPSVDAALYLSNGATTFMAGVDRLGCHYSLFELDVLGTAGRVRLVENGDRILLSRAQEYSRYPGFTELRETADQHIVADMGSAIPNAIREIVDWIQGRGRLEVDTGEEAYRDLCVLDAIAISRAEGCVRIKVNP